MLLSASEDRAAIDAAIEAGASGYVLKSVSALDVPAVVRQVAAGYTMFHKPASESPGECGQSAERPALTERESTILAAVAGGKTTRTISAELWVSEHTVKFHLTNIYRKLGVSNRSGAVRYAYENGLARPPPTERSALTVRGAGLGRRRPASAAGPCQRGSASVTSVGPAGPALDPAVAVQQPHPLVHPGQSHVAAARCPQQLALDVEATAVITHSRPQPLAVKR